jgi:hypothetical protein
MQFRPLALVLACFACLGLAPAAGAAAPADLHAFLLRATEPPPPAHTFARTPAFSWDGVQGATSYEFQLSTSKTFAENAIVWEKDDLPGPLTSVPLTLPWITGNPYSLYARVRANLVGGDVSAWSVKYGFKLKSPAAPSGLSSGANPIPGMVRWTPVSGATAYEVTFLYDVSLGLSKKIKTATTAADLRELYTFHNDLAANGIDVISWRVRALRELEGKPLNDLPVVSYGPWSATFVTQEPATIASAPITLLGSISRSRTADIIDLVGTQSPDAHELVPGFTWDGRYALDGVSGDCPALVGALGVTCPLFHVYVFTDEDCVNRIHSSDLVGSPAYVPRLTGVLDLPGDPTKLTQAAALMLGDKDTEGKVFDAGGAAVKAAGTQDGIPPDPSEADLPTGQLPDRKTGIWDNDWPESRYYWTAVPAIPILTVDGLVEYHDVEFAEDMCQAGNVVSMGKTSAPVIEKASGVPYLSGMVASGKVRGATTDKPQFYGRVVIAWNPAPGAARHQIQWSRKANPFKSAGSVTTPSTSALVNLPLGVWYYRVRGVDKTLPTKLRGMTWTDPQYVKILPRSFTVMKKRPL